MDSKHLDRIPIPDDSFLVVNEEVVETSCDSRVISTTLSSPSLPKPVKQATFFDTSDHSNGALFEESDYCWSQTRNEIEIHVRLPSNIRTSKHVSVLITPSKISISPKPNPNNETILAGMIEERYKYAEAMWTISSNGKLTISLDKIQEIWWKKLFHHEPTIDVSKIDCSRPIGELPDETQRDIERIQWDEDQKRKGNLSSTQLSQHEMLRKAWDVDGSPFKGMPFDPTAVQFANAE